MFEHLAGDPHFSHLAVRTRTRTRSGRKKAMSRVKGQERLEAWLNMQRNGTMRGFLKAEKLRKERRDKTREKTRSRKRRRTRDRETPELDAQTRPDEEHSLDSAEEPLQPEAGVNCQKSRDDKVQDEGPDALEYLAFESKYEVAGGVSSPMHASDAPASPSTLLNDEQEITDEKEAVDAATADETEEPALREPCNFFRTRDAQKRRADKGNGHDFKARFIATAGHHTKFNDDGTVEVVAHDFKAYTGRKRTEIRSSNPEDGRLLPRNHQSNGALPPLSTRASATTQNLRPVKPEEAITRVARGEAVPSLLETMPDDIFFFIFDCLSNPLAAHRHSTRPTNLPQFDQLYQYNISKGVLDGIANEHPFLKLALTSSTMQAKVENYCHHACQRITSGIIPRAEKRMQGKKLSEKDTLKKIKRMQKVEARAKALLDENKTQRINWLNIAWRRCLFCGKSTMRRAVFQYMTWCCHQCDNKVWPKIKRAEVLENPLFRPVHLDNLDLVFPGSRDLVVAYDWSTKQKFYLKDEVKQLEEYVRENDPDWEKTKAGEVAKQEDARGPIAKLTKSAWDRTAWSAPQEGVVQTWTVEMAASTVL